MEIGVINKLRSALFPHLASAVEQGTALPAADDANAIGDSTAFVDGKVGYGLPVELERAMFDEGRRMARVSGATEPDEL